MTSLGDNEMEASAPSSAADIPAASETSDPVPDPERVFAGTGLFWGLIIGIVMALAVMVLAAQNTDTVTVSFLVWEFSTPLIVIILGSLLIGIVLDELFGLVYRKRRRRTLRDRDDLKRLQ